MLSLARSLSSLIYVCTGIYRNSLYKCLMIRRRTTCAATVCCSSFIFIFLEGCKNKIDKKGAHSIGSRQRNCWFTARAKTEKAVGTRLKFSTCSLRSTIKRPEALNLRYCGAPIYGWGLVIKNAQFFASKFPQSSHNNSSHFRITFDFRSLIGKIDYLLSTYQLETEYYFQINLITVSTRQKQNTNFNKFSFFPRLILKQITQVR